MPKGSGPATERSEVKSPEEIIIEETNRVKIPTWEAKLREILFKPVSPPLSTKGREGSGAG